MAKGMFTAIGTLLVVLLILYLAYAFTKYLGRGVGTKTRSGCMQIKDQIVLGRDRSAAIVQIGERYFLIGITGGQISLLSELDEADITQIGVSPTEGRIYPDFKELMDKMGRGKKKDG